MNTLLKLKKLSKILWIFAGIGIIIFLWSKIFLDYKYCASSMTGEEELFLMLILVLVTPKSLVSLMVAGAEGLSFSPTELWSIKAVIIGTYFLWCINAVIGLTTANFIIYLLLTFVVILVFLLVSSSLLSRYVK